MHTGERSKFRKTSKFPKGKVKLNTVHCIHLITISIRTKSGRQSAVSALLGENSRGCSSCVLGSGETLRGPLPATPCARYFSSSNAKVKVTKEAPCWRFWRRQNHRYGASWRKQPRVFILCSRIWGNFERTLSMCRFIHIILSRFAFGWT